MAEISNSETGDLYLGVKLDILRKEPEAGIVSRGNVAMNSDMGLLWVDLSFWVGNTAIYTQEVLLHSIDVLPFASTLKEMIASESIQEAGQVRNVFFDDTTSPELHMRVKQSVYAFSESDESTGVSCSYQLRVMVDPGIKNGSIGVSDEGPAMILEPSGENLLAFARDWQSEAEMALLLG